MSLRTDLLLLVDDLRSLRGPDEFDVQTTKVTIVERTWAGGRRGAGSMVEEILADLPQRYRVMSITAREVANSGGRYEMEDQKVGPITPGLVWDAADATNTTPIVVTTTEDHGLFTGDAVTDSGFIGNTGANGAFTITKIDEDSFSLDGSVGNGTYLQGGSVQVTGFTPDQLKPRGETGTEVVYRLTGANDGDYQLIALHTEKAFSYFMVLRRTRTTP